MKKTNKGFSLVELIIVIAIMAILAGALAPALIKYINKSRLSSDVSNGQQISSAIQEALSNEDVYDDTTKALTSYTTFSGFLNANTKLSSEVKNILGNVQKAKSKKAGDGQDNTMDQTYWVYVDVASNVVEVYCGNPTQSADYMLYPTVGSRFTSK